MRAETKQRLQEVVRGLEELVRTDERTVDGRYRFSGPGAHKQVYATDVDPWIQKLKEAIDED